MDKDMAFRVVQNANMSVFDIAHRIYLATVEGVSGASQNEGYGFALSAIAELWNIKGTIGDPFARTKITGRYRGMDVTEEMILDIISQYPDGFDDDRPLFDDLLALGPSGRSASGSQGGSSYTNSGGGINASNLAPTVLVIAFVILKFILRWGWISSIIVAIVIGTAVEAIIWKGQGGGK